MVASYNYVTPIYDCDVDFTNIPLNYCGDGDLDDGEDCDDGNDDENDSCDSDCHVISHGGGTSHSSGSRSFIFTQPEEPIVAGEFGAPFLTISINPEFSMANAGDKNVKFSITVKNEGDIDAINSELNVVLPDGFSYNDPAVSGVWALGDIAPGAESAVTIFVDVAETADNQTYSIAATAKADNNPEVSAPAEVQIEEVIVLAETGFNLNEFLVLLFSLFLSTSTVMYLRKTS